MVEIDPDIKKARTLSSNYYTDSKMFDQIFSKFGSHWQYIGHISQFEDGSAKPVKIGNEQIIISKLADNFHCFSNVCTHRGMLLIDDEDCKKTLVCPYHGRTFSLDGKFKKMPEFEKVEDFPTAEDDLSEFDINIWKNMIFTLINQTDETCNWFEHVQDRMSFMDIENFTYDSSRERRYTIEANWILYVDNFLEGFHIPFVHKDLNKALDYGQYETELFTGGVLQIGIAQDGVNSFELPEGHPDFGKNVAAYYWWLFPNLMLNFYPWGLSMNVIIPISENETEVRYYGFVSNEELLGQGAGADLDKVELEDQFVVESCQKGMMSSNYSSGRYSPTMERGLHHFHLMLTGGN